jgi:hypothetical protein
MSGHFHGTAAQPSGDPPRTDPRGTGVIEVVAWDGSELGIDRASCSNHVTYTGESTFTEVGTISFGPAPGEVDVESVQNGTIGPTADPELLAGAVMYRIVEGRGLLAGASGLITSNFVLRPAAGEYEEWQVASVFLP